MERVGEGRMAALDRKEVKEGLTWNYRGWNLPSFGGDNSGVEQDNEIKKIRLLMVL